MKVLVTLSVLLNVFLIYFFVFKGATASANQQDQRVTIEMPQGHTDFTLAEMRGFLESVQQINEGILNNDAKKVAAAGKKSGGSVIAHAPQGFLKRLPMAFKQLGFSTHDIFDEIANSADNNFNPQTSQAQLNKLLNNCIACHQGYKIKVIKD